MCRPGFEACALRRHAERDKTPATFLGQRTDLSVAILSFLTEARVENQVFFSPSVRISVCNTWKSKVLTVENFEFIPIIFCSKDMVTTEEKQMLGNSITYNTRESTANSCTNINSNISIGKLLIGSEPQWLTIYVVHRRRPSCLVHVAVCRVYILRMLLHGAHHVAVRDLIGLYWFCKT